VWSSPDGVTWTKVTSSVPLGARTSFGSAVFNPLTPSGINQMWICGGFNLTSGEAIQDAWYSADGETWTQTPTPRWPARGQTALFMLNNRLYLLGGITALLVENRLMDMWIMDASMKWTQLPDLLPFHSDIVSAPACTVYNWRIWMTQVPDEDSDQGATYSYTP
jgi:hypothetical protein